MQDGVGGALGPHVERASHPQHGGVEFRTVSSDHAGHGPDLFVRPGAVEPETPGTAEEFRCVGHDEDRFDAHAEPSDLSAALLRHAHSKNCLSALGRDRISFVRAVQMGTGEHDVNPSAGLVGDFVGRVLDEFEKLAIAVSTLSDATLSVGVFGYETGVDGIRLEDTGRLFDNGVNYRRR
ncbi:hypothetical protein PV379_16940 [Streptomyces caniscabiei]|nr:hypothetical protein [Streptomyces caniscabiei]MDX2606306.1 hypothetical protein [Streptomyces caniscabiei]MDX2740072.1 hypothetical protein [Streptomyces caniscabiei]MDX2778992.1 hypothetical protein [Streptomyces caniscabiei]